MFPSVALFSQSAANVEAGTSAAGLLIDGSRALFGGTRAQGLRAGTSRFLEQGWFVGWKVTMALYCIVWAAWWDRGEDIEIRIYLATWTHLIATACEYEYSAAVVVHTTGSIPDIGTIAYSTTLYCSIWGSNAGEWFHRYYTGNRLY